MKPDTAILSRFRPISRCNCSSLQVYHADSILSVLMLIYSPQLAWLWPHSSIHLVVRVALLMRITANEHVYTPKRALSYSACFGRRATS